MSVRKNHISVCCVYVLQNNVKVHGLKEYVVTNIEEVTRVIFVGNSEFFFLFCFEPSAPFISSHSHSFYPFISLSFSMSDFSPVNRTTGETKMNERSSRSHAVLSLAVESRLKDGDSTVKVASLVCLSLLPYTHPHFYL